MGLENTEVLGTARLLSELAKHDDLVAEYDDEVANKLLAKSLTRHKVPTEPEGAASFVRIAKAIMRGNSDLTGEVQHAEGMANDVVGEVITHLGKLATRAA